MDRFQFEPNQKIKLIFARQGREENYFSTVQDIAETTIGVGLPMEQRAYIPVAHDESVRVIVFDKSGVYYFFSRCREVRLDPVGLLILEKPDYVHRVQRREFDRVRTAIGARFVVLSDPDSQGTVTAHATDQVQIYDLCAKGMCLISHAEVAVGSRLEIRVYMPDPDIGTVTAVAKVIRVRKDQYVSRYYIAVSIEQIDAQGQRYLCRFIDAESHRRRTSGA